MSSELSDLKKEIHSRLPSDEADALVSIVEKADARIRNLKAQVGAERTRAESLKLPEGAEVRYKGTIHRVNAEGRLENRGESSWKDVVGATMQRDSGVGGTVVFE